MNNEQNLPNSGHELKVNKEIDNSGKIAGARAMIYIPAFFSIAFGLLFMYVSNSDDPNDVSGLTKVIDVLVTGGLFALSLLITTICALIGLTMLKRMKK